MIKKGIAVAILTGAVAAFGPKHIKRAETNSTATDSSPTPVESEGKAPQTAVVAASAMSDESSKMAVDYNGYYYGSSGNVEEYQSWLVSRPLLFGSNSQPIDVLLSTSNKWSILQSKNCSNCYGQAINPSASTSYKP